MSAVTKPSEDFTRAFGPLLDELPTAMDAVVKKATDDIYGALLDGVQTYIRSNVEWNIGSVLDRGAQAEADSRVLAEKLSMLLVAAKHAYALIGQTDLGKTAGSGADGILRTLRDAIAQAEGLS